MDEDAKKKALQELSEQVTPLVTKEVVQQAKEQIMNELPQLVKTEGEDEAKKLKEQKEKAVNYFKGVVNGDRQMVRANSKAVFANEGTSGEGKEWAPEYFETGMIEVASRYGLVRQKATRVPLPGRKVTWPAGGEVAAFKVNEGAIIPARKPTSTVFTMEPEKLGVLIPVTKELVEDSALIPDLIDYLRIVAGRGFSKLEDAMALGTTGSSDGEGVFKKTGVPEKVIAGDSFADVTPEELLAATELLDDDLSDEKVEWVLSRSMRNVLLAQRLAVGTDKQEFIYGSPIAGGPRTIWDYPLTVSRSMPKRADDDEETYFAALVDWANVMFGERREFRMELSDTATFRGTDDSTLVHAFAQDILVLKFTERIDVELANHTKAFVRLKTAATP